MDIYDKKDKLLFSAVNLACSQITANSKFLKKEITRKDCIKLVENYWQDLIGLKTPGETNGGFPEEMLAKIPTDEELKDDNLPF
ncbi:hypothetical protein PT287_07625 [Lactobacillus sp. ESL0679]|uniref:hypothetical protein n=1 Tax=Lactobacillus sp. ESL0679 TaxID=2983209 RepID=UPI0023F901B8|nr:hypothetical protein [Lactobacillus sp. ESL0679]MDF7683369.1 hypothetical protein [Lactobacillus sp. ESL0679]